MNTLPIFVRKKLEKHFDCPDTEDSGMNSNGTINRRNFLGMMGIGAGMAVHPGVVTGKTTQKPNIVVVLCDDLGYGDLGCYGHSRIETPRLDEFAEEGVKFTDCYAGAPVCSPARAAMLTGRTPYRTGVYDYIPGHGYSGNKGPAFPGMRLLPGEISVATLLRDTGYDTCHLGKWHLSSEFNTDERSQPGDHGFNYWFSTYSNAQPSHRNPENFVRNGAPCGKLDGYAADLVATEGIEWLTTHRDPARPFCMFVWFHEPHEPIATDERFTRQYAEYREANYYGNVSQIDHSFGRLMDTLDGMGVRDTTFVMFTSDNGPETLLRYPGATNSFGSPGRLRGMKLHTYEGGIRVPGMIRYPALTTPGTVSDVPISGTDVLPTLCGLAGIPVPADRVIDGVSILPALTGQPVNRTRPLYWRYDLALNYPFAVAMRHGDWKILGDLTLTRFELYNLRTDPTERYDLTKQEPEVFAKLRDMLCRLHTEIDAEKPYWRE